jgi:Lrp/AsnC family transcriptional regulator of ectoine degradation
MKRNNKSGVTHVELDRLDIKILSELQENGRITKVDLSDAVGLSPTPCCARIARLEEEGLIRGYHADVDIERLGDFSRFIVTVSIKDYTPEKALRFESIIAGIPYIVQCDAVFGSIDYVLHILALGPSHYHQIVAPMLVMEIDYTTFPVSKSILRESRMELRQLLDSGRVHRQDAVRPEIR